MLSDDEKTEIDQELTHYEDRQAVSVEALKAVQKRRGWVSDEALKAVADYTGLPANDLEAVATFYNLIYRQPVGRHVIHVCDSVSCYICGYDSLKRNLEERLGINFGQTTQDGRFTLLPICCLGHCDHAPALMIDNKQHGDVGPDTLDEVLGQYD